MVYSKPWAPRILFLILFTLIDSSQLCLAQTQVAELHSRPGLVWKRVPDPQNNLDGPVLYQLLFFGSGTPGTIAKFDSNPRHLANSLLSEVAGKVTVNGNFQVAGAGNKFMGDGSGLTNLPVTGINGGTVTQVIVGTGLSAVPSPITNSGTISLNTGFTDARYLQLSGGAMAGTITFAGGQTFPGTGSGTVTSIAAGSGLTGGTITTAGTLAIDATVVAQLGSINSTSSGTTTFSGSNSTQIVLVTQNGPGSLTPPTPSNPPPTALLGQATAGANFTAGVLGTTASADGVGVAGVNLATGAGQGNGVVGFTQAQNGTGVDGRASATTGTGIGVSGRSDSNNGVGVQGNSASGTGGVFIGDVGISVSGTTNAGLFNGNVIVNGKETVNGGVTGIEASGGVNAGIFHGNVTVTGGLSKGAGSFKIDHPLDPANKYLQHSFVESPDMMNIYNGNAVLDKKGEAVVQLPDWFEALNRDFRYQLTCIGAFAPVYIAEEINHNHFTIAGGKPGTKVSWQVTGVRHDAYADAHRIRVEEEKTGNERGTYLHPELFGQPESKRIGAVHKEASTTTTSAGAQ